MCGDDWVICIFIITAAADASVAVVTVVDGDDRGVVGGMAQRSVIGQPIGYYWLLKLAPFHSGFNPYPIIADDASVVAIGDCDDGDDRGAVCDDVVNVRQ